MYDYPKIQVSSRTTIKDKNNEFLGGKTCQNL